MKDKKQERKARIKEQLSLIKAHLEQMTATLNSIQGDCKRLRGNLEESMSRSRLQQQEIEELQARTLKRIREVAEAAMIGQKGPDRTPLDEM